MQTERIVVLISPEEKSRLQRTARANKQSLGEFVRTVLSVKGGAPSSREDVLVTKAQRDALEHAAKRASAALKRGNESLDRAFAEIERTREYFGSARVDRAPSRRRKANKA